MWLLLKAKDNFIGAKTNQDRALCMQASSVHKLDDSHLCCVAPPELNLSGDPGKPALPLGKPFRCTLKEIGHQVLVIDVCLRLQWNLYWVSWSVVCWSWQIQSTPCKLGCMLSAVADKAVSTWAALTACWASARCLAASDSNPACCTTP